MAGPQEGVEPARWLCQQGAAIIDVGARSSNFPASDVSWQEELRRLVPIVEALVSAGLWSWSNTWEARVMDAVTAAGAHMIRSHRTGLAALPPSTAVTSDSDPCIRNTLR